MDRDEVPSIDSATSRAPTVVMTGATNGFGLLAAAELASRGARLVLVVRSEEKGAAAAVAIRSRVPTASVDVVAGDVASLALVRAFAATVKQRCSRIDVLINNAGAVIHERRSSVDGHELMLATNYLGAFALTTALLDRLQANAPSRVISTTSFAERLGPIRFDDVESARAFSSVKAYGQSKRALLGRILAIQPGDLHDAVS